jgi:Ribonuclease G/E
VKGRVILIDHPKERASQAALLVDGRLEDLLLDPLKGDTIPAPGEIYWAKVDRLVPKMGGAFVKLTPEHMGFLREAKALKDGQGTLVQVTLQGAAGHPHARRAGHQCLTSDQG